ncbi:MAG: ArgE/DapE family deacylase [Candidatus Thorarchaeota archaeon]
MNEENDGTTKQKVFDWIDENEADLVNLLQDLVRIPSVSGKEYDVQVRVQQEFEQMGLFPEMVYPDIEDLREHEDYFETTSFKEYEYEDRPNVVGVWEGTGEGKSMCLSGHIDVVPVEPLEKWSRDPWSGEVDDGGVYGRGSGDMKGGVAAMIHALKALQKCDVKLAGDVQIETTIEEEDGGIGGVLYLRMVRPPTDAAIIPEPTDLSISVASAGVMYFRVTVPGRPAHAATAHYGVNAAEKAIHVIQALAQLNQERQRTIHYSFAEVDPKMKDHATTINLGVISAGDWPSTVPGNCVLEYRIGWPPGETRGEVMEQVENAIQNAAQQDEWLKKNPPTVEWFGWWARPHEIDLSDSFLEVIKNEVESVTGSKPVLYGGSAGLDTRHFVHHGIPAVTCGPRAERIHSFDEVVHIDSLIDTAKAVAATTLEWCGQVSS